MPSNNTLPSLQSSDHGEFDAHWIRSLAQEGHSRWYIRPRIASTALNRNAAITDIQRNLTAAYGPFPGKRLLRHLSHLIAYGSGAVHLECQTPEEMIGEIRCAMISVAGGEFMILTEDDPLFPYGCITKRIEKRKGQTLMSTVRILKATTDEKKVAHDLVGNRAKPDDLSLGSLPHILEKGVPHLITLNMDRCADLAFPLRKDLHRIIGDSGEFDDGMRRKCVETIFALWDKTQPAGTLEHVVEAVEREAQGGSLYDIDPTQMINQYINPVMRDMEAIRRRLTALELVTFNHAVDGNAEHCRRLSAIWEVVFPNARIALCDALNNVLAYLASVAGGRSMETFRDGLGPSPDVRLPPPAASSSRHPAL